MKNLTFFLLIGLTLTACKNNPEAVKNESSTDVVNEEITDSGALEKQKVEELSETMQKEMEEDMEALDMPEEEKDVFMEKVKENMKQPMEEKTEAVKESADQPVEEKSEEAEKMVENAKETLKETVEKTDAMVKEAMDDAKEAVEETVEAVKETPKPTVDESTRSFVNKEYSIKGNWSLKVEGDKTYVVLHSNFKTKNGPDLKVFLSKQTMAQVNGRNALKGSLLLKPLKSNKGEQRYLIPMGINLTDYKSMLIHCEKYSVLWGGGALR